MLKLLYKIRKKPLLLSVVRFLYSNLFSYPKSIQIHINTECNLNCVYCYVIRHKKGLSRRDIIRVLNEAKQMGVRYVEILGGEPLLRPDLPFIIDYIYKRFSGFTIFTNGLLIDDNWIKRMEPYRDKMILTIKFDLNKKTYQKHTGSSNFEKLLRIIKKCTSSGIKVVTFVSLTKWNVNGAEEIIRKSTELKAYPAFERYIPIKDKEINEKLEISAEEWSYALISLRNFYGKIGEFSTATALLRGDICACYHEILSIDAEGFVLPCPFSPKEMRIGNIKNESLQHLWKRFKKMNFDVIPEECKKCKFAHTCSGGCKTYAYLKKGRIDVKDPLCTCKINPTYGHCVFPLLHHFKR